MLATIAAGPPCSEGGAERGTCLIMTFRAGDQEGGFPVVESRGPYDGTPSATPDDAARFRALAEHALDLISEVDEQSRLTYVCPQVTAHLGYAARELIGKDAGEFVHPEDRDRAARWLDGIMHDTGGTATYRLQAADGHWRLYETSASAYDAAEGRRAVLVSRDITARQDSQEEELRAVLNHLTSGVVILDFDLRARFVNPAMADMLGYTIEELLERSPAELTHPDDHAAAVARGFDRAAGKDVPARNRLRLMHRDGHVLTTEVVATPYARDGIVLGELSEFRDVSDQLEAEEALAASEARYRQLFELVQDGLIFSGADDRVLLVNDAFCQMVGYPREELIGSDRLVFIHPEERGISAEWHRLRRDGWHETRRFPRRLVRKDGSTVYTETQVASLFQDGEYAGVLAVHTDITERLELEREAERQRARAQRAALREEFMAIVSHELRTPLTSILGFGELLELGAGGDLTELQREYVEEITQAGGHLLQLINDVLDLSKMEAHRMEVRPARVDPRHIVQEAVRALEPVAQRSGVVIAPDLHDGPEEVEVDPRALRQVVNNLVSNAVKFTQAGTVGITLETRNQGMVLWVQDTGIGIPGEQLEEVFEPFRQAQTGLDRPYGGSGLGLTIAARLVELHQGRIMLCSTPGTGTTVRAWIPLDVGVSADGSG